jgi:CHAT domain-containing protein
MSIEPRPGMSIDPETLAAYIDKRLSAEQRAAVEAQLAADPDSYALLVETLKAQDALGLTGEPPRGDGRWWVMAASALAAAAAIALAVWLVPGILDRVRGPRVDARVERLVAAAGDRRYLEGRLTGGFKYGPLVSVNRGADLSQQNLALLAAAGELQQRAGQEPSAGNLHAWGSAQLLLRDVDGAVTTLRSAVEAGATAVSNTNAGESAAARSDLAAALLERALLRNSSADLTAAIDEAEAAIRASSPPLVEALFNRARALEALGLRDQASAAWRDYLAADGEGAWADEARRRLLALSAPQSRLDPLRLPGAAEGMDATPLEAIRLRVLFERRWLPRLCSDADVQRRAGAWAADYRAATGDASFEELIAAAGERRCELFRAYADAQDHLDADRLPEAAALLTGVARDPQDGGPLAWWATYHLASMNVLSRRFDAADRDLQRVVEVAAARRYASLHAHALWTQALLRATTNAPREALLLLDRSLKLAQASGEVVVEGRVRNQLADLDDYLGDGEQADVHRSAALQLAMQVPNRRLRHSVYGSAAAVALRRGLPYAGRALLEAQYQANAGGAPPASMLTLLLRQVDADVDLQDHAAAARRLESAERYLAELRADPRALTLTARVALARARQALAGDQPDRALAFATDALSAFDRGRDLQAIDTLLVRARAARQLAKLTESNDDIAAALQLLTARRNGDASFFGSPELGAVQAGVDELIESGLPDDLSLQLSAAVRRLMSPVVTQSASEWSPDPTLYIRVLPGSIRAWCLVNGSLTSRTIAMSRADAVRLVKTIRNTLTSTASRSGADHLLETGFSTFITPFLPVLSGQPTLRIVADWPLDGLPFAALRDPRSSRYLAEDHAIIVTPTLAGSDRVPREATAAPGVLVVANPRPIDDDSQTLPALPFAEQEAAALGGIYSHVRLLKGPDATAAALFASAPGSRILHIAAHAVIDRVDGRRSRLMLARHGDQAGAVFGEQLAAQQWRSIDTVILAACATAEPDGRPSSPMTLASQVLAAGPKYVVATLWPIDDRDASGFFLELHRQLASGVPAPEALRRVQVTFIGREQTAPAGGARASLAALWPAVTLIGS